jgi:hypothetical protein
MRRSRLPKVMTFEQFLSACGSKYTRFNGPNEEEKMKNLKDIDINAPWWEASSHASFGNATLDTNWAQLGLEVIAIAGGPPRLYTYKEGSVKNNIDTIKKRLLDLGGKVVSKGTPIDKKDNFTETYIWTHGCVELKFNGDCKVELICETNNQEFINNMHLLFKEEITNQPPAGRVHVVTSTDYGLEFESMGIGGHLIERDNYNADVLVAYDKIVKDLKAQDPTGRLSIFNGPPGTGKTYLVKAILQAADNSVCVVVPASLVPELSSPSVIPSLINLRKSKGDNLPIVLIIEDADECLVSREDGNMSSISSVLNLCDGILGALLDIRIIATTNADRMQLDKALIRPGRLSANVEVQALDYEHALKVIRRISNNPEATLPTEGKYTLAELYNLNKDGKVAATGVSVTQKGKMGFT